MSEIKDKKIGVYAVITERDLYGNEVLIKRYIHGRGGLWAHVREVTQRERFAAKAAGSELDTVFKVNYNARIEAGQKLEYKGETYVIETVGGKESYKRDLILTAVRAREEQYECENYDE